ncbi:MAG: ATP-binding cassette domain-containing protein [Oscillospiraceae bacterium]
MDDVSLSIGRGTFVTLCGKSGCGKTTLLRQLKTVLAPHGCRTGTILFEGQPLEDLDQREQSSRIGFVLQSPENQIVTDKVWHELAFGMESLGYDTPTIRLRVAEMASFFGIQTWFYKNVSELSGGQKQLLNLAAVMAMQPSVLILDEPTSQLDPIAAADFLSTVGKINRELGTTVILTEHRMEEALPLSDRVVVMDEGVVIADGDPRSVGTALKERGHDMFLAMPAPMRIYAATDSAALCPITVRDGRDWLTDYAAARSLAPIPERPDVAPDGPAAVELSGVWFRYDKDSPDVVKGLDMVVPTGRFFAIVGGNGTGKSTTLSLISGVNTPHRGEVRLDGRKLVEISDREKFGGLLGVLPQNPQALFVKKSVELDLYEMLSEQKLSAEEKRRRVETVVELCELGPLLGQHPYDLSGGEQQRAALGKVLLLEPRILLLDEPTKGLDGHFKEKLAHILGRLRAAGATILMVSHDVEFCAKYADRCAMFFDGSIVTEGPPRSFFAGNSFYTTAANRMARGLLPGAVTAEDVICACGGTAAEVNLEPTPLYRDRTAALDRQRESVRLPKWRKVLGGVLAALGLILAYWVIKGMPIGLTGDMVSSGLVALPESWGYTLGILVAVACAVAGAALLTRRTAPPPVVFPVLREGRKLSKRTVAATVMILLLIPLTLYVGVFYLGGRKYYFISLLIVLETMLPFFLIFEGRKPQARELVVIAVLCAITVAGRAAFFFLPQFKPVAALVIIAAVAFGGEAGFLVGALSMLVSNLFFGQGTWMPFQMFAMGIVGFLAGVLFRKGLLGRNPVALCVYGGLAVFFIYGFIMNTYSVLQTSTIITWPMILTACLVGVPMDLVHALATVFFLYVAAPAMKEKLDRIKVKYGLVE